METQSKEKASGTHPEAEKDNTLNASIVNPKIVDSIDVAVSADIDPCGFAAVVERIRGMPWDEFKASSRALAKEVAEGSSVEVDLMFKVVKGVRSVMKGEEREKAPWETDPKPWPKDVDLLETIREIENIIRRVMVCEERYVTAAAYYIAATWFVDYVQYAPYAVITAPAKRCGKSVMLDLMGKLVKRPYAMAGKPSEASIFRTLDANRPTLLLDEVDTYLSKADELQGILNGGISKDAAFVSRCEKDVSGNIVTRNFRTFGFKIMSGIGADRCGNALVDRAIVLRLSRKSRKDTREKLRHIPKDQWEALRSRLMRLSLKYAESVEKASASPVNMPEALGDRDCDKWEVLFILADLSGEDEGRRVRNVACEITGEVSEDVWPSELISDSTDVVLKAIASVGGVDLDFGSAGRIHVGITDGGMYGDCILSTTLYQALTMNPDWQWKEFGRSGRALPQRLMTRTITDHGVKAAKLKKANGRMGFKIYGDDGLMAANERYGRRARKDE